jgi:hypothetical protein
MVEVGYRLAAQLPLVLICDEHPSGGNLSLPAMMGIPRTIMVPCKEQQLNPDDPKDKNRINEIVEALANSIDDLEGDGSIGSEHPVALVHRRIDRSNPGDPEKMFFVSSSERARELFGFEDRGADSEFRLAGRSMKEFLNILKFRMPRRQYDEFLVSQDQARSTWVKPNDAPVWRTPSVQIPIYFDRHPNEQFIGRGYLPIVVSKFDSASWSTLRVLYLDVTSVLQKNNTGNQSDDFVYTCSICEGSEKPLKTGLSEPLHVFLCHNSQDKRQVETTLHHLAELSPLSVHPWIDETDIIGGDIYTAEIGKIIREADVAFVFFGKNGCGPFQEREIDVIVRHATDRTRKRLVVLPVLLDNVDPAMLQKTPPSWELLSAEHYTRQNEVNSDDYLIAFFEKHFPGRLVL